MQPAGIHTMKRNILYVVGGSFILCMEMPRPKISRKRQSFNNSKKRYNCQRITKGHADFVTENTIHYGSFKFKMLPSKTNGGERGRSHCRPPHIFRKGKPPHDLLQKYLIK